ncbi:Na+/H+ antiporter subunit E [Citricoccus sp. NR2]|uniref:Na+/H+ antiporter subunit E n=1 Tax=Citricoccus sp. NR2 TaxID=3004095 RepID=UPI0022DD9914|nr:Na+/H+ antiporter subunit E [Citricoccus sp. NR2]WBL20389.1 Na+/H+ antiporter subunit E [Citricoccus sp. NR2]
MSDTTESSAAPRYRHTIEDQISLWSQWPTVIGLTLLWCALWQDFRPGTLLIGLVVALFVLWAFRLPRVPFPGRINLWYTVVFTVVFLWKIVLASIDVARDAIVKGPNIINSVVAVRLRSHDDLIVTAVGHALALIPGSLVIDVDRPSSTLYLHVLDAENQEQVDAFRQESLSIEARIIRAIGSREDYALVRAEDQAGDGVIRRHLENTASDTGSDAGADAVSEAEKGDRA